MDVARSVTGVSPAGGLGHSSAARTSKDGSNFGKIVADQIRDSNAQQIDAEQAVESLATGEANNVEDVVLSMVRADLSFRMLLEIRNRVLDAYQEIMRMQV